MFSGAWSRNASWDSAKQITPTTWCQVPYRTKAPDSFCFFRVSESSLICKRNWFLFGCIYTDSRNVLTCEVEGLVSIQANVQLSEGQEDTKNGSSEEIEKVDSDSIENETDWTEVFCGKSKSNELIWFSALFIKKIYYFLVPFEIVENVKLIKKTLFLALL